MPSSAFRGVKITLIVFQSITLVLYALLFILSIILVGAVNSNPQQYPENAKALAIALIVICVIAIIVEIIGLVGAVKENLCLTLTFAIIMTLGTISTFSTANKNQMYTPSISLIVTILAYVFAYLLHKEGPSTGSYA